MLQLIRNREPVLVQHIINQHKVERYKEQVQQKVPIENLFQVRNHVQREVHHRVDIRDLLKAATRVTAEVRLQEVLQVEVIPHQEVQVEVIVRLQEVLQVEVQVQVEVV